ncbi:MAG TPA: class II aldolase/adducin family protein [Acidisarcina sp.]
MTHRQDLEPIVREVTSCVLERLRRAECVPAAAGLLADSPETARLKAEMVHVGRKLWDREYVDGNGGNLSVRLCSEFVLSTPTMMSKGDLQPDDICLCDMSGVVVAGPHQRSSELLLHLEIYKANPNAKAVVHCHPPHATAFAATGAPPPYGVLTEQEIFIGPVAMAPYETPGTQAFAETVLPFVHQHNTILLQNHGIVCWSDTLTHAEWLAEIFDTYCRTIILAKQMGTPLCYIADDKIEEILELKRRMGFPDARITPRDSEHPLSPDRWAYGELTYSNHLKDW